LRGERRELLAKGRQLLAELRRELLESVASALARGADQVSQGAAEVRKRHIDGAHLTREHIFPLRELSGERLLAKSPANSRRQDQDHQQDRGVPEGARKQEQVNREEEDRSNDDSDKKVAHGAFDSLVSSSGSIKRHGGGK
jgi:hypothetical protein